MVVLDGNPLNLSSVLYLLVGHVVLGDPRVCQDVARVFVIREDVLDVHNLPPQPSRGMNTVLVEPPGNLGRLHAFLVLIENPADDRRFFLHNDVLLFVVLGVTVNPRPPCLTVLRSHAESLLDALGNVAALFLGEGAEDGQEHFRVGAARVDLLLFKLNRNAQLLQFLEGLNGQDRVPGKAGNALAENPVKLVPPSVAHHPLETRAVLIRA